jgi:predicted dehydrogenase
MVKPLTDKHPAKVRIGIIGTGLMAQRMVKCASIVPGAQITAIASCANGSSADLAASCGAAACATAQELAERDDVDAVYVATIKDQHWQDTMTAIAAGKPALVEKPFALTLEQSVEVVAAAREADVLLVENLWFLAMPAAQELIARIEGDVLGTPWNMVFDFGFPVSRANYPALHSPDLGVIRDRGVSGLAFCQRLLGPVDEINAQGIWDEDTDVAATMLLKHRSGAMSQITVSFRALLSNTATFSCSGGFIRMEPALGSDRLLMQIAAPMPGPTAKPEKPKLKSLTIARVMKKLKKSVKPELFPFGSDMHLPMLIHFCDLVRNGSKESPLAPLDLSLNTQHLVLLARQAIGAAA